MKKKLISFMFMCLLISFIGQSVYGAYNPTKFINDRPWAYEVTHNWVITASDGCVIPHTAFDRMDSIYVEIDRNRNYMTMSKDDKTITIDLKTRDNIVFGTKKDYLKIYEFRTGVYWLPAEVVCDYLGLTLEIYQYGKSANESVIRISDESANKELTDLIKQYNPDIVTEGEETNVPEPSINDPDPIEVIGERLIFLTFEGKLDTNTEMILDLLNQYQMKATFFITGENLTDNTDTLRRIIVEGHSIGLHTMTHNENKYSNDFNSLIDEFNTQNDILYKLTKYKTRLCRAPEGSSSDKLFIDSTNGMLLYELGYIVWDWNVNMSNPSLINAESGIKRYTKPVLRFESNDVTLETLPEILEYIASHEQFKVTPITESVEEINFIGKYK